MSVFLRRHLTPIRDISQQLHLILIHLVLQDEGVLPTLGKSYCLQGWSLPQQGGVRGALPPPTGVGHGADNILKDTLRKQSTLLCSTGAAGAWGRESSGTAAFQNLGDLDIRLVSKVLWGTKAAEPFIAWIFILFFLTAAKQNLSITKIQ